MDPQATVKCSFPLIELTIERNPLLHTSQPHPNNVIKTTHPSSILYFYSQGQWSTSILILTHSETIATTKMPLVLCIGHAVRRAEQGTRLSTKHGSYHPNSTKTTSTLANENCSRSHDGERVMEKGRYSPPSKKFTSKHHHPQTRIPPYQVIQPSQ